MSGDAEKQRRAASEAAAREPEPNEHGWLPARVTYSDDAVEALVLRSKALAQARDQLTDMHNMLTGLQDALLQQTTILQSLAPVRNSKGRGKEPKTIMAMSTRDAMRAMGYPEAEIQKTIQLMLKAGSDSLDQAQKARANEAARKAAQRMIGQDGPKSGTKSP
jgi:hypothetical protein